MILSKFPKCLFNPDFFLNLVVVLTSLSAKTMPESFDGPDELSMRTVRLMRLASVLRIFLFLCSSIRFFKFFLRFFTFFDELGKRGGLALVSKRMFFLFCFLGIMSLIATSFFWKEDEAHFGCFSRSLFSMFQIGLCGDPESMSWELSLAPDTGLLETVVAVFFTAHILGCYALILYAISGYGHKEQAPATRTAPDLATVSCHLGFSLDPLLSEISKYVTIDERDQMIEDLFKYLASPCETKACPANEIGFAEMRAGLRILRPPVYFNVDHWDSLVGGFLQGKETLDFDKFRLIMLQRIKDYILKRIVKEDSDTSLTATKLAVKMILLEGNGQGGGGREGGLERGRSMTDTMSRQVASLGALHAKVDKLMPRMSRSRYGHLSPNGHSTPMSQRRSGTATPVGGSGLRVRDGSGESELKLVNMQLEKMREQIQSLTKAMEKRELDERVNTLGQS